MKKRTLVIGDIHGGHKALEQVLKRAKITTDDTLIFLGDYVDGWSGSAKVISTLIELGAIYKCVFIRGNHDSLAQEYLETGQVTEQWLAHGGDSTLKAYQNMAKGTFHKHLRFLKSLQNFYTDVRDRLFLHAGFSNMHGPEREYADYVFYWDRSLWETALATDVSLQPGDYRYPKRFTHFSEIFIGHTPTTRIGKSKPVNALNLWNVDTGAAFKGRLSILDADSKAVYQSDPVHKLYPDERGRN